MLPQIVNIKFTFILIQISFSLFKPVFGFAGKINLPNDYNLSGLSYIGFDSKFLQLQKESIAPLAAQTLCQKYPWACQGRSTNSFLTEFQLKEIARINKKINLNLKSVTDKQLYGIDDFWTLPSKKGGDCEDFVLIKKLELIRIGISPDRLLIATVLDRKHEAHAVLILRSEWGDFVLDNLTSKIQSWTKTKYTFLQVQKPNQPRQWAAAFVGGIFGYE